MAIFGKPGEATKINKNDPITPDYQREVDDARVNKMANNWNWYLCGSLYIAQRAYEPGSPMYVVDGLQRLTAARKIPEITFLPALLFDFDGPQHEAQVFHDMQTERKGVVTRDRHKALLIAGDETALHVERWMDRLDARGILSTVSKLMKRWPDTMDEIEPLIHALCGHDIPVHKAFLQGVAWLSHERGVEFDMVALSEIGYAPLHKAQLDELNALKIARGSVKDPASAKDQGEALERAIQRLTVRPETVRDREGHHIADLRRASGH